MAVTSSVLVNDGGAPARIINLEAASAITAGMALEINSSGKVLGADTDNFRVAGFALVDAAAGDLCSVVTGSGVVLNVHLDADTNDIDPGNMLMVAEDGALKKAASVDSTVVAIAMEAATGTPAAHIAAGQLFKVLVK